MSTDRELVEKAAKVAGLKEHGWMGGTYSHVVDNTWDTFRPLEDDGDALRLAVKLRLMIVHHHEGNNPAVTVMVPVEWHGRFLEVHEPHGDDAEAATRRAITRAAAELGKVA